MKKICISALSLISLLIFSFSALAGQIDAAVGGWSVPFSFSDVWKVSTPDSIDKALCERRSLDEGRLAEYMKAFGYCLWLINEQNNAELIVTCANAAGQKDYSSLSENEFTTLVENQANALSFSPEFQVEKVQFYRSGNLRFAKYTIYLNQKPYIAIYDTVSNGYLYSVRAISRDGESPDYLQTDALSLVDSLGTVLSFPQNAVTVPNPTVAAETTASGALIFDLEGEDSGEFYLGQSSAATKAEADSSIPATEGKTNPPDVIEIGTDGLTMPIEELHPEELRQKKKESKAWIIAVIVLLISAALIDYFTKKRKKEDKKET